MGTNTSLITIPTSSSRCTDIPQDDKNILPGALINYRLDRGKECILHGEITLLIRSICRDQGDDNQGTMNPSSHNTVVDRCYRNYHWSQLIGHSYSNSLGMVIIRATRPIVDATTATTALLSSLRTSKSAAILMSKRLSSDDNR